MLDLDISGRTPRGLDIHALQCLVRSAYRLGGGDGRARFSLSFVNDAEIRRLNRRWRGRNKATDVLSFGYKKSVPVGGRGRGVVRELGDVIISVQTARRQAKSAGRTLQAEVSLLLVHGFLHLLGYDHAVRRQEDLMFGLQQEILMRNKIM